jgi:hypothetical protein
MTSIDTDAVNLDLGADATSADLYRAGLACSTGQGAPLCYIEAHKWFNLAALAGVQEAKVYRRELADLMSSEEIAAAQASARQWLTECARGRRTASHAEAVKREPARVAA